MISLDKLIELYTNRKDSFKKAEERSDRREKYFQEISAIKINNDLNEYRKRALKNSAAQKLSGSGLVTYEFVDYYCRNPNFTNFEIIAPIVFLWEQVLKKTYDESGNLIHLEIIWSKYIKELALSFMSFLFIGSLLALLIFKGNTIVNFFSSGFYVSQSIVGIVYLVSLCFVLCALIFFLYLFLSLSDLRRLVK